MVVVCALGYKQAAASLTVRLRRTVTLALRHQPNPLKGSPRLSFRLRLRAGADQAHTLSRTNRPLNRPDPLLKSGKLMQMLARTTKSAAGSGAVPLNRSGSASAFPRRVRVFRYTFA